MTIGSSLRKIVWFVLFLHAMPLAYAVDEVTTKPQVDPKEDLYRDVAGDLRCPTCTGLSVLDSDAPFSVQIKSEVKTQLAAGKTRAEVLNFFVDRYGPWILRAPPVSGVNALAWLLPIAAIILGPLLIWFFVGRNVRKTADVPVRPAAEIIAEMKKELATMRLGAGGKA